MITLTINGERREVDVPLDMPLLWVLRDVLSLTGTKFGCGIAQCGACTVHLAGKPVRSCLLSVGAIGARAITTIESNHPRKPHYYLPFVGVEPELQGKGVGTALLAPVLNRCDREGTPAYLEATTTRNRACYLRQGFAVTEEFRFPKGGPPSWRMWREPRG